MPRGQQLGRVRIPQRTHDGGGGHHDGTHGHACGLPQQAQEEDHRPDPPSGTTTPMNNLSGMFARDDIMILMDVHVLGWLPQSNYDVKS